MGRGSKHNLHPDFIRNPAPMLEARQGAAYTGENMTSPESPAILYEHADGRRAVVSANRVATFAIDNPDWHRAGPVEIIWVDEPTGWRPIEAMRESDADEVLVWKPGIGLLVVIWLEDDHPDAEEGAGWHEAWSHKRIYGITHGMPAPLPPSPSSADEGGSNG